MLPEDFLGTNIYILTARIETNLNQQKLRKKVQDWPRYTLAKFWAEKVLIFPVGGGRWRGEMQKGNSQKSQEEKWTRRVSMTWREPRRFLASEPEFSRTWEVGCWCYMHVYPESCKRSLGKMGSAPFFRDFDQVFGLRPEGSHKLAKISCIGCKRSLGKMGSAPFFHDFDQVFGLRPEGSHKV
eukprot:g50951.t1